MNLLLCVDFCTTVMRKKIKKGGGGSEVCTDKIGIFNKIDKIVCTL